MTPDDLKRIANTNGYGTGKFARDCMAAEAEIRQLLPDPKWVPLVVATGNGGRMSPMCNFGNSGKDGQDWEIEHDAGECEAWALGQDAKQDAEVVAAIINAYRLGIIGVAT